MARLLDLFQNRSANTACRRYPDAQQLLEGLRQEESEAIRCLSAKIAGSVYQIGKNFRLSQSDMEELLCDCILLFIEKIRAGKYEYQGYEPSTYVIEIAKRRVRRYSRMAEKNRTEELDPRFDPVDEPDYGSQEQVELLQKLLSQLKENCQKLIRLKYLEERKDKEVIDQNLTQYSTVDALKNHRARCMKKLTEIAEQFKQSA